MDSDTLACLSIYMPNCLCVCMCVCIYAYEWVYVCTLVRVTNLVWCMWVLALPASVDVDVYVCMCACVHLCIYMCVLACVRAWVWIPLSAPQLPLTLIPNHFNALFSAQLSLLDFPVCSLHLFSLLLHRLSDVVAFISKFLVRRFHYSLVVICADSLTLSPSKRGR